jgi:hypothetical protein
MSRCLGLWHRLVCAPRFLELIRCRFCKQNRRRCLEFEPPVLKLFDSGIFSVVHYVQQACTYGHEVLLLAWTHGRVPWEPPAQLCRDAALLLRHFTS